MVDDLTLFGRDRELARLAAMLDDACAGAPATLLVTGPPGIGKTTLLQAVLADRDVTVLTAAGDEHESDLDHAVVDQLRRSIPRAIREHVAPIEPGAEPLHVGAVLLSAIDRLQADRPVAIVVDDAQWADAHSLAALAFVSRRLQADAVLLALACRSDHADRLPPGLRRAIDATGGSIALGGLDVPAVAALAEATYARPLSPAAARRLAEHAGGNPLHVRALLSELSHAAVEAGGRLPVPTTFAALVLSALRSCSPAAERLAAALSVLGSPAALADAAAVAGVAEPLAAVEELAEHRLVVLDEAATGPRLRFAHQLVQATVERDLSRAEAARLHGIAASVVRGETALRHRLAASSGPDPELVQLACAAAEREPSPERAAGFLLAAAPLTPSVTAAQELVLRAATLLLLAGEPVDHLVEEIAAFPPSAARGYVLGRVAFASGRLAEAERHLRAAWSQLAERPAAGRLAGPVADMLAILAEDTGRFDEVAAWARRALRAGSESMSSATMLCFGRAVVDGPAAAAREMGQVLAEASNASVALDAQLGLGIAQVYANDLEAAEETLAAVLVSPRIARAMLTFINARCYLAERHYRAGRWADALDLAESTASVAEDSGQGWLAVLPHGIAAFVLAAQGAGDRAREHATAATEIADAIGLWPARLLAEHAWLRIAAATGDHERVAAIGDRLVADGAGSLPEWVHHWRAVYAEALVAVGRLDDAAVAVTALEREAAASDRSIAAEAGRARGVLASACGDGPGAEAAFAAALALDPRESGPFARALLELAAGAEARRRRRRRDAAALLAQAAERLDRLGAAPWLERCDREAAACGLRPAKRSQPRDHDALTPRERIVARLVATGLTNREVAAELMLSEKTIEHHLGRVYRKLDVRSRTELAARLMRDDAS